MSPKGPMSRLGGIVVIGAMSAGLLAGCGEKKHLLQGKVNFPFPSL